MRVYVAARLADAPLAASVASSLRRAGYHTTSRWHERALTPEVIAKVEGDTLLRRQASAECYRDLAAADALVLLAHKDCRGALMELADAYRDGKRCVVIGNPFELTPMADRPDVCWVDSIDAAINQLNRSHE